MYAAVAAAAADPELQIYIRVGEVQSGEAEKLLRQTSLIGREALGA